MNNYLISNAGYAVATYFLAVGDRHLENLLVKNNGDLFHLDFGFILGNNPKSKGDFWVPPIRINKHMVNGMGGQTSEEYKIFKQKTIDAFLYLRNYRQLFLNILLLMVNASIPDLPFATYQNVLNKMNRRFLPELSNEEARAKFSTIIDDSVNAGIAEIFELVHKFSIFMKT